MTEGEILALVRENKILRERIRHLEAALAPRRSYPAEWRLSPKETKLLSAIHAAHPQYLSYDAALRAVYRDNPNAYPASHLSVFLAHVRRKLRNAGVHVPILNVHSHGWRLLKEGAAVLDAALDGAASE